MTSSTIPANIQYVAQIEHVKEVMLYGTADLKIWTKRLSAEGLRPAANEQRAEVLLTATDLKWRGMRFNEFTISLGAQLDEEAAQHGYYLAQAVNSSRLLAFSERTLFRTPYEHGAVTLRNQLPAAIGVQVDRVVALQAQMSQARPCLRGAEEMWEGPIYLPRQQKLFFARLGGFTETYAFLPDADSIMIQPSKRFAVFQWLCESGFTPHEWRIRHAATHAKSKTYPR
jgi:hypothetical protein